MNTIEKRIVLLREHAPILAGLCLAMHDRPEFAQLEDWVYNCSGSYATLGALLGEMLPSYEGLVLDANIGVNVSDGHNAFEEFVITVWDAIAKYNKAINDDKYDMDAITAEFLKDILSGHPDWDFSTEPATDDTGGGRY